MKKILISAAAATCISLFVFSQGQYSLTIPQFPDDLKHKCFKSGAQFSVCDTTQTMSEGDTLAISKDLKTSWDKFSGNSRRPVCRNVASTVSMSLILSKNVSEDLGSIISMGIFESKLCAKWFIMLADVNTNETVIIPTGDLEIGDIQDKIVSLQNSVSDILTSSGIILATKAASERLHEILIDNQAINVRKSTSLKLCRHQYHKCNLWRRCCEGLVCQGRWHGRCKKESSLLPGSTINLVSGQANFSTPVSINLPSFT